MKVHKKFNKKKVKIIISIFMLIIILGGVLVGNYFYNLSLNPTVSKDMIFESSDEEDGDKSNWILDESNYVNEYITSEDGLELHAYGIENTANSNVWVISVHGYTSQGSDMEGYAKGFYEMGYNVLVPDLRGHGTSEGDYIGMGWDDRLDIIQWINYIIEKNNDAKIILHGVSMGAATVMMVSGEELPSNVKCIIEDSGYTSVWDEFSYQLKRLFNLPQYPVMELANVVTIVRAGYSFSEASAIKQLENNITPMLFIHGSEDTFVPFEMLDELYNATSSEKEKVVIEGSKHTKALEVNPELYWQSITEFINKYIY